MSSKIYTLGYTGPEVDEAIAKIQDLDLDDLTGGIVELPSTEANPYNLDFLRLTGVYVVHHVYNVTAPAGVADVDPVYVYASKVKDGTKDGRLVQSLNASGVMYTRESTDGGRTWDIWEVASGFGTPVEITAEDVYHIFDEVFGTDSAMVSQLVAANKAAAARKATKTDTSPVTKGIAF